MKPKHLYKLGEISGWLLVVMLFLYFTSGYAMVHKYGMNSLMSGSQAWFWHSCLTLPFIIILFLHITPYYIVRKQLKKFFIILSIVIALPAMSVYAINKIQKPEVKQPEKIEHKHH